MTNWEKCVAIKAKIGEKRIEYHTAVLQALRDIGYRWASKEELVDNVDNVASIGINLYLNGKDVPSVNYSTVSKFDVSKESFMLLYREAMKEIGQQKKSKHPNTTAKALHDKYKGMCIENIYDVVNTFSNLNFDWIDPIISPDGEYNCVYVNDKELKVKFANMANFVKATDFVDWLTTREQVIEKLKICYVNYNDFDEWAACVKFFEEYSIPVYNKSPASLWYFSYCSRGEIERYTKPYSTEVIMYHEFVRWVEAIKKDKPSIKQTTPPKKATYREQIVENSKKLQESIARQLTCRDEDGKLLCAFNDHGEYQFTEKCLTPENMKRVAEWIGNMERER